MTIWVKWIFVPDFVAKSIGDNLHNFGHDSDHIFTLIGDFGLLHAATVRTVLKLNMLRDPEVEDRRSIERERLQQENKALKREIAALKKDKAGIQSQLNSIEFRDLPFLRERAALAGRMDRSL